MYDRTLRADSGIWARVLHVSRNIDFGETRVSADSVSEPTVPQIDCDWPNAAADNSKNDKSAIRHVSILKKRRFVRLSRVLNGECADVPIKIRFLNI